MSEENPKMIKYTLQIPEEKNIDIAEREVKDHVRRVMQIFARDNYGVSDQYDPRMDVIVREQIAKILRTEEFLSVIRESIKKVLPGELVKLIVDELENQWGSSDRD